MGNKRKKFFKFMDNLPVVKILQVVAAVLFICMTTQVVIFQIPGFVEALFKPFVTGAGILAGLLTLTTTVIHALYMPLIMIALAEIIKLLRK